jgi:N-acyl-D-aspartate/D-glutamate deacylase
LEEVNAAGGKVFGQSMPRPFDLNMRLSENSFLLLSFESWRPALQMSVPDRIKYFSDPENQKKMVAEMNAAGAIGGAFSNLRVGRVENPESKKYERRYLSEIAEELGSTVPQVIIDIALADGLDAEFQVVGAIHSDPEFVSKILDHPLCLVGASDAGAHIAQFCGAGDTCYILSKHVRERGDMTIERAVYRMTGEAAEAWGIKDRGVLKEGLAADVIVFDPATIDRGEEIFVHDFPGDANRYIRHPSGIAKVIVNGEVAVDGGEYTANRAGAIV